MPADGLASLIVKFYSLLVCGALFFTVATAQTTNVTARDSRITYIGDWVDQDNGGHEFTGSVGSSFSFTFQGTAISWYSSKDPKGGVANVFVDSNGPHAIDASAGTSVNDNPATIVMFSQSNLDPSQQHTINVSYVGPGALGGPYVTIFLLGFTPSDSTVVTTTHQPGTSTQTTLQTKVTTSTSVVLIGSETSGSINKSSSSTKGSTSFTTSSPTIASILSTTHSNSTSDQISTSTSPTSTFEGIEGTGSQSTPSESHSPDGFDASLRATQRMSVILGAVLGSIFGLLFICTIVLLSILYRKRQKVKKESAAPFSMRESLVQRPQTERTDYFVSGKGRRFMTESQPTSPVSTESGPTHPRRTPFSFSDITGYFGQSTDNETLPPEYTA